MGSTLMRVLVDKDRARQTARTGEPQVAGAVPPLVAPTEAGTEDEGR